MKHLEQTVATYVYSLCNVCNILIYFCNIHMKHLQYTSETSETLKTYACNMRWSGGCQRPSIHLGAGTSLPFLPMGEVDGGVGAGLPRPPKAQAHAFATSPFATGKVDGHEAMRDGRAGRCRRARDKAAKGGCSAYGEWPGAGKASGTVFFVEKGTKGARRSAGTLRPSYHYRVQNAS
jgi:hypothetical protein